MTPAARNTSTAVRIGSGPMQPSSGGAVLVVVKGFGRVVPGVVPVAVVLGPVAVPAAVAVLERRMIPVVPAVVPGDHDALAGDSQLPHLLRVDLVDAPGGIRCLG
jgi:hypothetical protein